MDPRRPLRPAPLATALLALLALSACQGPADPPTPPAPANGGDAPTDAASPPPAAPAPSTVPAAFDCGGTALEARFADGTAVLQLDGESIALAPVAAASGARFQGTRADGVAVEFWNKGPSALLSVAGNAYPECVPTTAAPAPPPVPPTTDAAVEAPVAYSARGNEPSWSVEANALDVRWQTPGTDPATVFASVARADRDNGFDLSASRDGGTFALSATRSLCRDSMTGLPYPDTVTVRVDDRDFNGCGGDPRSLLTANEWTVTSLGKEALGEAPPTLAFLPDGRAGGFSGCNRWSAPIALTGEGLSIGPAASTMMACPETSMAMERRFLDALSSVTRHDFDANGALVLLADDTPVITANPTKPIAPAP